MRSAERTKAVQARALSAILSILWIAPVFMATLLAEKYGLMVISAAVFALVAASIFTGLLMKPHAEARTLTEGAVSFLQWSNGLVWSLGLVLLCCQAAVIARILAERTPGSMPFVKQICRYLFEVISPWLPALRNLPSDMALHGFSQRADVVTDSYALAYAAALTNIGIFIVVVSLLATASLRRKEALSTERFSSQPLEKRLAVLFGWPLLLAVYVHVVFFDTGVNAVVGRKETLAYFETSDFHLYFRILFGTHISTIMICAMLGLLVFLAVNAVTARYSRLQATV